MPKWRADRRIYLSENDELVDEASPGRKTLLAAEGAFVPDEICQRYGLGPYAPAPSEADVSRQAGDESVNVNADFTDGITVGGGPRTAGTTTDAAGDGGQEPTSNHRHHFRVDGTCRCGAVKDS